MRRRRINSWCRLLSAFAATGIRLLEDPPIVEIDRQAIRDRAHAIWEREGRPSGRDRDHWLQAAWELAGEQARAAAASALKSPAAKPRGKTRKGAKAPK